MTTQLLPPGYHYVTSKENCWLCLDSMAGDAVIAHDGALGKAHPAHKFCLIQFRKHYKNCCLCQTPLARLAPLTYWENKQKQMSAIYSIISRSVWVGTNRLERVNGIFAASIGAAIALASDAQNLTSIEIAVGGMWGLISQLSGSSGFKDLHYLLIVVNQEAHERLLLGVVLGKGGGTKTGRGFFAGMLTTATAVSLGGGPLFAFTVGAFTGTALEQMHKIRKFFNPSWLD